MVRFKSNTQRFSSRARYLIFSVLFALAAFHAVRPGERAVASAAPLAGNVYAIAVSGNDLYVGGSFTSIGNINANNIAKFNRATNTWSALGGGLNSLVSAIAVNGSDVYVGGRFSNAVNPGGGNVAITCVVKWNSAASVWEPLGASGTNTNGVNADVNAIAVGNGSVYVGGAFTLARNTGANTVSANSIARWNGTAWSGLGTGTGTTGNGVGSPGPPKVFSLAVSGSDVYVAGNFTKAQNSGSSSISTNCIARWNSSTGMWSALGAGTGAGGNGVNGDVFALAANGAEIYAAGNFSSVFNNTGAGLTVGRVAKWNGSTWSVLGTGATTGGNGVDGNVYALAVGAGGIYVGGDFTNAYNGTGGGIGVNAVSANCVTRWTGTSWSALGANGGATGNGMDATVSSLATSAADVFAGGEFANAYNSSSSKVAADTVARWNGSLWSGFGGGTTGGGAVTTVSAASFSGSEFPPDAIVSAYGGGLATTTLAAATTPLPTSLGGTTVKVRDGVGTERLAPLFFVSPGQINYLIPTGSAAGAATVTIAASDGKVSTGGLQIAMVSPALFAANANGQGVAAATAFRLKGNGAQSYESIAQYDAAQKKFVATPIDLGPTTDQVFLILYGSGVRYRSALSAVTAQIGGTSTEVFFAGPQGALAGLDQINLRIPRSLIGRGEVDVALIVDGKPANLVRASLK